MKPGWQKYLNPFYFEPRLLRSLFWGNLVIVTPFIYLMGVTLIFRAEVIKAAANQAASPQQLSDTTLDDTASLSLWFAILLGLAAAMLMLNAFCLLKAYRLLKSPPKTDGSA